MPARYSLARKRAHDLLAIGKIEKPPVPVERLAALAGAEIRYEPFAGDLSGIVHRTQGNRHIIGVNSLHPLTRRRFTIAHELGHLLLHKDEELHIDERFPIGLRSGLSSLAQDDREIEANQFAAELLMPLGFLREDLESLRLDVETEETIHRLAERYQVSVQAMTVRLTSKGALR
jgi:Zn-dependent peptidase ImmA (M78 family)